MAEEQIQLRRMPGSRITPNNQDHPDPESSAIQLHETTSDLSDSHHHYSPGAIWERVTGSNWCHFFLLLGLCAFIGIGLPIIWTQVLKTETDLRIESDLRYECYPLRSQEQVTNTSCLSWKNTCIWDNQTIGNEIACYYETELDSEIRDELYGSANYGKIPRYSVKIKNPQEAASQEATTLPPYVIEDTMASFNSTGTNYSGDPFVHVLHMAKAAPFMDAENQELRDGPLVVEYLSVHERHYAKDHVSILIKPAADDEKLWSQHFDMNYPDQLTNLTEIHDSNATVQLTPSGAAFRRDIFQLQVRRKSSGKALFSMGSHTPFIFSQGYIEISTMLPNDIVYGLGQANLPTFRHNFSFPKTWTLLSQYTKNLTENSTSMFGSQPFFLGIDDPTTGDAYGVLLLNSFPITVTSNARPSLTFKTYGGHLEFHFFLGPRPADVLKQLQSFIHRPAMPPYWALGFHSCVSVCQIPYPSKWANLTGANIPVESDCGTAIRRSGDEGDPFWDFQHTLNQNGGRKFLSIEVAQRFDKENPHWAPLALVEERAKMAPSPYVGALQRCTSENRLERDKAINQVFYPDVFHPATLDQYSKAGKDELHTFADGYFLDFNTPANFRNDNGSLVCLDMLKHFNWNAWNFGRHNELNPCMDLTFAAGGFYSKLDRRKNATKAWELGPYMALHNMYGYRHAEMVYKIAQKTQPLVRPLVMSLSTFLGSGRFGGHIGSPLNTNWTSLRLSLKQTLDFSIFGIPLSGFPVGGYRPTYEEEPVKDELIRRWFQLASVQPFMIAYTDYRVESRDLLETARGVIRSNIQTRYKLLPYYYTLFQRASTRASLVVQPLFIDFYDDEKVYKINEQFMIGSALLASPSVTEGESTIHAYFPKGRWYEYYSGHLTSKKDGGYQEISAVEQNINLHLRGGYAVATHSKTGLTIRETRRDAGFQLVAALNEDHEAVGELYLDDGKEAAVKNSMEVVFKFDYHTINISITQQGDFCKVATTEDINTRVESLKVYGIIEKPQSYLVTVYNSLEQIGANQVAQLKEPDVKFQNNFGVLSIEAGKHVNLCKGTGVYSLAWNYVQY